MWSGLNIPMATEALPHTPGLDAAGPQSWALIVSKKSDNVVDTGTTRDTTTKDDGKELLQEECDGGTMKEVLGRTPVLFSPNDSTDQVDKGEKDWDSVQQVQSNISSLSVEK
jgi:hypothetical protein